MSEPQAARDDEQGDGASTAGPSARSGGGWGLQGRASVLLALALMLARMHG